MKKFQVLRIGIFVVVIGLIITAGTIAGLQWKEQREFIKNSQLYEDTTHGFAMRYPSTWDLISEQDLDYRNEQFVVGVHVVSESSTAVGVIVQDRTTQENLDDQAVLESIEKKLSETYTSFKKSSSKKVEHAGYQELDIDYTYKRSNKIQVHQRQRIFITPQKIYYISGSVLVVNYSQRQQDLQHIMDSFVLLEASGGT